MRRRAGLLAAIVVVVAAGCGGSRVASHGSGPGGTPYAWPPPSSVRSGPPSTSRFCALLEDDLEHVAGTQEAAHGGGLRTVVPEYLTLIPGIEAAAPSTIAPEVRVYFGNLASILALMEQYGYNYFRIPTARLQALNSAQGDAAATDVTGFSNRQCHFDMNSVVAPSTSS